MWMTGYAREILKAFRDQHGFTPTGGTDDEPTFADGTIPPGEYPMTINGKVDRVRLNDKYQIKCCNFDEEPNASPEV